MKRILIFLFLSFAHISLSAQNLSLAQLLIIQKMDIGEVEEYLTARGWVLIETGKPDKNNYVNLTFAYDANFITKNANFFLTYINLGDLGNCLQFQINIKDKYIEYLNAIKGKGYTLVSTDVEDDQIVKVYLDNSIAFEITTPSSKPYHIISIFSRATYIYLYAFKRPNFSKHVMKLTFPNMK